MRRIGIIAVLSLIVTALAAVPALAVPATTVTQTGGLHVCQGSALDVTADKTDGAILTATGEVCGAGPTAAAELTSTALVTVGCVTPSGSNEPKGLQTSAQTVVGSETFQTRAGRGAFNFQTTAVGIPAEFDCPSANMEETLVSVTFTNIKLTITSAGKEITAKFPDIGPVSP